MMQYAACFLPQVQVVCLTPQQQQAQQAQQEGGPASAGAVVTVVGFRAVHPARKTVPMSQEKQHLPASSSGTAGGTEIGDASSEAAPMEF